jgi:hypothetical protein
MCRLAIHGRVVNPILSFALACCLASPAASDWETYGPADRAARQDAALGACRTDLDLDEQFGAGSSSEYTVDQQAVALNCELESWRRSLHTPGDPGEHEEEINAHLRRLMDRIALGISVTTCTSTSPRTPSGCFENNVIARAAAHLTAYILNRYTERSWETATLDTAKDLYRSTDWWQGLPTAGNSTLPLIGMRLLGGEALDDPVLESRGIAELHFAHGRDVRQGIPEPMSRHYAGVTIGELELLRETNDPDLREMVEDLLAVQLLVNAHNYLPGGQIGAPQDRKDGPLDETLTVDGNSPHLLNHLNMVVYDPDLPSEIGHDPRTLASDYTAPEVIRSIFLDKGDGYTFWYRGDAPTSSQDGAGYEGERHYPSYGWQGFDGPLATGYESAPTQTVTLANGSAQMGVRYAPGGETGFSNGLFARDTSDTFSVYYHHQPRPDDDSRTSWNPLAQDPEWRYEKQSYRRMMHGRTVITLFEPDDEHSFLEYTIAHLPGAIDAEITECEGEAYSGGNSWLVRQHEDAWVAYLPLGDYTATTKEGGAWTFLEFEEGTISGNISEIADGPDFGNAEAYCNDLATRGVQFDDENAVAQIETTPPGGAPVTIKLDYHDDERSIDSGSGFVVQSDDGFVDKGLMYVEPVNEAPWLTWNDEFELEVERAPHASVTLDFGDPTLPSPPQTVTVQNEAAVNATPIQLVWDHGIDDEGIVEYKVWRDGVEIGSVYDEDPGFEAAAGAKATYYDSTEPAGGGPTSIQYRVESVDGNEQHSPVMSMIKEVTVKTRPTAAVLTSAAGGVKQVALGWTPATDHVGIVSHEVVRDGNVVASLGASASSYVDTGVFPSQTYEYVIRAHDSVGLSADSNEESESTPVDNTPPGAPPNLLGTVTGSSATIWWNSASDDWGIIAYQILRNGVPIAGTSLNYFFETRPPGTYVYTVKALDWGLNLGAASPSKTLTVP